MKIKFKTVVLLLITIVGLVMAWQFWQQYQAVRNFDYLESLYPTAELTSLFDRFPKGFKINHARTYQEQDSVKKVTVSIEGYAPAQRIIARARLEEGDKKLEDYYIDYLGNGVFNIPADRQVAPYLKDFKLLISQLPYSTQAVARAKPYDEYELGSGVLKKEYYLKDIVEPDVITDLNINSNLDLIQFSRGVTPIERHFSSSIWIEASMPTPEQEGRQLITIGESLLAEDYKEGLK